MVSLNVLYFHRHVCDILNGNIIGLSKQLISAEL